jgi:hypothetical protein
MKGNDNAPARTVHSEFRPCESELLVILRKGTYSVR